MVVGIGTQITSRLGFENKGRLYRDQLYSQRGSFSQNTRQRRENDSNPEWPNHPQLAETIVTMNTQFPSPSMCQFMPAYSCSTSERCHSKHEGYLLFASSPTYSVAHLRGEKKVTLVCQCAWQTMMRNLSKGFISTPSQRVRD